MSLRGCATTLALRLIPSLCLPLLLTPSETLSLSVGRKNPSVFSHCNRKTLGLVWVFRFTWLQHILKSYSSCTQQSYKGCRDETVCCGYFDGLLYPRILWVPHRQWACLRWMSFIPTTRVVAGYPFTRSSNKTYLSNTYKCASTRLEDSATLPCWRTTWRGILRSRRASRLLV